MKVTVKCLSGELFAVYEDVTSIGKSPVPTHIIIAFKDKEIIFPAKDFIFIWEDIWED